MVSVPNPGRSRIDPGGHGVRPDELTDVRGHRMPLRRAWGGVARGRTAMVGDAAGHCLPVSGEGIRPALVFGQLAGRLAERVRLGELTRDQALSRYRSYVLSRKRGYDVLDRLQAVLNWLPDPLYAGVARVVAHPRVMRWAAARYWDVADPELLTATPSPEPIPLAA